MEQIKLRELRISETLFLSRLKLVLDDFQNETDMSQDGKALLMLMIRNEFEHYYKEQNED